MLSFIQNLVGLPAVVHPDPPVSHVYPGKNVIVIAEVGFSHGTQNGPNRETTVNREQGEQNHQERRESDTRKEQTSSFDQSCKNNDSAPSSKNKESTSITTSGGQDCNSSHGTRNEEGYKHGNTLNSNERYRKKIVTFENHIGNESQQNDKISVQVEEKDNFNNSTQRSKNNISMFRDSNKQPTNEKGIKDYEFGRDKEDKSGAKFIRSGEGMQNAYRFQRNDRNETVDLHSKQSTRRYDEVTEEAKLDPSSGSNNDKKEGNQKLYASGQARGHQGYNRFQRGGRNCNQFQNGRGNYRRPFNNGQNDGNQTGNWQGDQYNHFRGRWIVNNRGFSNNRQERSDHQDQQRSCRPQFRKGNAQFIDKPNFNRNEDSRPNSVQSNYEVRESENSIPERPGSSHSDYQRNACTSRQNDTRRKNFRGQCKTNEHVFAPNFNHNEESRPNSVQSNYEVRESENSIPERPRSRRSDYQRNSCTSELYSHDTRRQNDRGRYKSNERIFGPNFNHNEESRPNSVQSNYEERNYGRENTLPDRSGSSQSDCPIGQRNARTIKPNPHGRNCSRTQDCQGRCLHEFNPNFNQNEESRPNSVQSNYEERGSENCFSVHIPDGPVSSHSNYQRNVYTNTPNCHDIKNNARRQDFEGQNILYVPRQLHHNYNQYGNNRGFRGGQNHLYNQNRGSQYRLPNAAHNQKVHERRRGNGLGGTEKMFSRMKTADEETKTNITQEINIVNKSESEDESEDASEDESDESNVEKDQPFQVSSLDFKNGFPLDEAEAARRNINLNEDVTDVLLFGKDGDVVVTEEPKTLRDMMNFMQKYPNASAITIKE